MASRYQALLREIQKADVDKQLDAMVGKISLYLGYIKGTMATPTAVHVTDKHYGAVIKDKLRVDAKIQHYGALDHREDGPYYKGVKLLPVRDGLEADYIKAAMPKEAA